MWNKYIFLNLKWPQQDLGWYTHFVSLCMSCVSPHMIIYLWPIKLTINFGWYFLPPLQSPNLYHSLISIFDSRQQSVYIDFIIKNTMRIEISISSQIRENSRPYFDRTNPPPRGGFLISMFPHQELWVRGPPSKNLYQVLRGGSSYSRFLMREHSK